MNLIDLESQSLRIMKSLYDERRENIVQFSGGKDSIVLLHLAKKTGLGFSYTYQNTTIDPPKHIGWIRRNFPEVSINQPRYSFWELIEKYGLPTRQKRFCCQHLKEYIGKGAKTFEGLRIDESKEEEINYSTRGRKKESSKEDGVYLHSKNRRCVILELKTKSMYIRLCIGRQRIFGIIFTLII